MSTLKPVTPFRGRESYFPGIDAVTYEGPASRNPLAFKVYNPEALVAGKTMRDHLRFAVAYWHSFTGSAGNDPFGPTTLDYPWNRADDAMTRARQRADAAFEFMSKLGVPFYCFHDVDVCDEGESLAVYEERLEEMTRVLAERQEATGIQLLWNTANLFSNPRYMHGAATNPDFSVVARAAAQVKACLEANVALGGHNYVFWGGREGYSTLLNSNTRLEQENLAAFLRAARDYGRSIGFTGTFLIEPKPMEPTKHQYDFDAATVIGFLHRQGLAGDFQLNIEANHATLANHSFAHELQTAADASMLGSIDANRGDPQNGWDTDQFPTDMTDLVQAVLVILGNGGFTTGGVNFDAKLRRGSVDLEDLFHAHIGGMDAFARALQVADALRQEGTLEEFRRGRYASFDEGQGAAFRRGELTLEALRDIAAAREPRRPESGRQEYLENLINQALLTTPLA